MTLSEPQLDTGYLAGLCSSDFESSILVDLLAEVEAMAQIDPVAHTDPDLLSTYYCSYLLALFMDRDLNEARFLLQRIPKPLSASPAMSNAVSLLRALYSRSYPSIYSTLDSPMWPQYVVPLRNRFLEHFRNRTFFLLSKAYTSISPLSAAYYLGFGTEDGNTVVEKLVSAGWTFDRATGLLQPVVGESTEGSTRVTEKDDRIKRLTALVTHLTEV